MTGSQLAGLVHVQVGVLAPAHRGPRAVAMAPLVLPTRSKETTVTGIFPHSSRSGKDWRDDRRDLPAGRQIPPVIFASLSEWIATVQTPISAHAPHE